MQDLKIEDVEMKSDDDSEILFKTLIPSFNTSGPMPSPFITATL